MMILLSRSLRLKCLHHGLRIRSLHRSQRCYSTQPIRLRPYQEDALAACEDALRSGDLRIAVSLPTGSGKTIVFLTLLSRIQPPADRPHATRSLVIVSSVLLAAQVYRQAKNLFPEWNIEIEQGGEHNASGLADLTIATYQTLCRPERLAKFDPQNLKAIIVDEAHHSVASSYLRILSRLTDGRTALSNGLHRIPVVGLSATLRRADKQCVLSVYERLVYHVSLLNLIAEGWSSFIRFTFIKAPFNLHMIKTSDEADDFSSDSLAAIINTEVTNKMLVQTWREDAGTVNFRKKVTQTEQPVGSSRSTLVFCVNLEHVGDLMRTFREAGIDARCITSRTPMYERSQLILDFEAGKYPVLVNHGILLEGVDIPCIDCIVIARPTKSHVVLSQMVGRGTRHSQATGKQDCLVIMLVDTSELRTAVSIRDVYGLTSPDHDDQPDHSSYGTSADKRGRHRRERSSHLSGYRTLSEASDLKFGKECSDIYNVLDSGKFGAPHLFNLSRNGWIGCIGNIYILNCFNDRFLRVQPLGGDGQDRRILYKATVVFKAEPRRWHSKEIFAAGTLAEAVQAADQYAEDMIENPSGLRRDALWRLEQATDKQKDIMRRQIKEWTLLENCSPTTGRPHPGKIRHKTEHDLAKSTKGELANIIGRLVHNKYDS
ncbi:hypothetical protein NM688_g8361 [Phlebia brevispora]|uniref:Uncharacterized protein n=1 Tax=Phlebia brevispora TaxID=194682 RepID=A0ACC1RTT7_9APHY|nr:hypothetical protein NM688_g8361 [Phlebia brevispora]